jgi:clan AA aspartic protease
MRTVITPTCLIKKSEFIMGVFSVPTKMRNWQNQFLPPEKQGEEINCDALVDTGAIRLALPADLIARLKLQHVDTIRVFTADGGEHNYRLFGIVEIDVQGRTTRTDVIELPHGTTPLLGAVPLEEMDWHVSPCEKKLVPNPRSPEGPLLPLV